MLDGILELIADIIFDHLLEGWERDGMDCSQDLRCRYLGVHTAGTGLSGHRMVCFCAAGNCYRYFSAGVPPG